MTDVLIAFCRQSGYGTDLWVPSGLHGVSSALLNERLSSGACTHLCGVLEVLSSEGGEAPLPVPNSMAH